MGLDSVGSWIKWCNHMGRVHMSQDEVNEATQFLDRNIFDLDLILGLAELRALVIWHRASTIVSNETTQKLNRIAQLMAPLTPEQREMVINGTVITEQLRDLLYTEALQAGNNVSQ